MARLVSWLPRLPSLFRSVSESVRSHYASDDLERLFQIQPRSAQMLMHLLPTVGSVAKSRHGRGWPGRCRSFQASSRFEFELFSDDCDGLRERTGADSESAFDDTRLAANVLRKVEDRRLALA